MALTADAPLVHETGDYGSLPVKAATTIYESAMIGDDASGYARGLVAGDPFRGHCIDKVDNSLGAAGAKNVRFLTGRYRLQVTITSVAITDVGKVVYASADDTLTLSPGTANTRVGVIVRYVTTNTCVVEFQTVETPDLVLANSARSRASTAMPTDAIWNNFNLIEMRNNPFAGSLLESDFARGEIADDIFQADATAAVFNLPGTGGIGEMVLFTSADNEEAAVQWNCPIVVSGGNSWGFEARVKVENITDARATCVLGLMFRTAEQAGDVVADDGAALTDGDLVGFVRFAADGDIWDFIYDEGGQATNVHDDDYHTAVADTYVTLGMYFNGTTIQGYVDGVAVGTAISADDIAAADFPTAAVVVPTLAVKGDNAADFDFTVDWIKVAQLAD